VGQKVHPYGFRLGFNKTWKSRWFADRDYAKLLHEDLALRADLKKRFCARGRREDRNRARRQQAEDRHPHLAPRHHHRPQGHGGREAEGRNSEADQPRGLHQHPGDPEPELDAQLIAESVAQQLEKARGVPPRDAQGRRVGAAVRRARHQGARVGRLNGAEIARSEWYLHGQLPLQTLRADIDYGFAEASTTYGQIGVRRGSIRVSA
jgi:small subunit ribosomal protein S3